MSVRFTVTTLDCLLLIIMFKHSSVGVVVCSAECSADSRQANLILIPASIYPNLILVST